MARDKRRWSRGKNELNDRTKYSGFAPLVKENGFVPSKI